MEKLKLIVYSIFSILLISIVIIYSYKINTKNPNKDYLVELVKPAQRNPEKWREALCNDGSPFSFVISKPLIQKSNTWVIYLQGGGFCDDFAENCQERLKQTPLLTTTLPGKDTKKYNVQRYINAAEGVFNFDPDINPLFHNTNKVYAHYCSSDLWTGSKTQTHKTSVGNWYFTGKINVKSMFETLITYYNLNDNNPDLKILFIGTSAGGIGVDHNIDMVSRLLPKTAKSGNLKLVSDGSFPISFQNSKYTFGPTNASLEEVLNRDYIFFNSSLNNFCEKGQKVKGKNPSSCFMGKTLASYITNCDQSSMCLPRFVQQSSIDNYQLEMYGIIKKGKILDQQALEIFKTNSIKDLNSEYIPWLFSSGETPYHTLSHSDQGWLFEINGKSYRDSITKFWLQESPERLIF
jgi:Pectinacetylesterase